MSFYKTATLCLLAYLAYSIIAGYEKYRRWVDASNTTHELFIDFKAASESFDSAMPGIDSMYVLVKDTTAIIDSATKATIDSLVFDLEERHARAIRISNNIDVFAKYVKDHEPFWHHVYASLAKR